MSTTTKINYAKETKALIKDGINRLGGDLTNLSTFRSYASVLNAIYNALPKVSGEGSNISLSPTLKGGLDITPKGACEQDSTTGKNKFSGFVKGKGLNFTTGVEQNDNNAAVSDYIPVNFTTNPNYIVSGLVDTIRSLVNAYNSNKESLGRTGGNAYSTIALNSSSFTSETPQGTGDIAYIRILQYKISSDTGTIDDIDNVQTQLEIGSTATSYEQYTGGIPSPNPSYPQDVRVVTGENSVNVSSKNKFELQDTETKNGVTFTRNSDGTFNISTGSGTATANTQFQIKIYKTLTSGTYTFSKNKGGTDLKCYIQDYDGSTWKSNMMTIGSTTYENQATANISPVGDSTIFVVQVLSGVSIDLQNVEVQLESGDTKTNFVPHAEQKVTLHLSSNYLAGIDTYKDEIVGKKDDWKIVRKIRHLSLAIADMDNSENYPGWKNTPNIVNDLNIAEAIYLFSETSALCNIVENNKTRAIRVGANSLMFLDRTIFGSEFTQTYWKTNYPNLSLELYYGITNTSAQYQTPITDTTLISDLNNMYNLMGYDGQTNITISSNLSNAQMTAQVKALKGE